MRKELVGGGALVVLALFMLMGYLGSDVEASGVTTLVTLLITVALPGGAGLYLLKNHFGARGRLEGRKEVLRQQTLDSEILRLAGERGGKLTVVEVVSALALPADTAKGLLDGLVASEIADIEVSDSGVLVYAFHDIRRLGEKEGARGVLDG